MSHYILLSVCEASGSPDQISTFFNIYIIQAYKPYADPVPQAQLNNFSFNDSFDKSSTVYLA